MKKTIKNAISSLTAKFAALLLLALGCAGNAWGVTVATEDALVAALSGSDAVITLNADIQMTATLEIGRTVTLDLGSHTLKPVQTSGSQIDISSGAEPIIQNGTINIDGCNATGEAMIQIGPRSGSSVLTLSNVRVEGANYSSANSVFRIFKPSTVNLNSCVIELNKNTYSGGGTFYGDDTTAVVNITDSTLNLTDVVRGLVNVTANINNSTMTVKASTQGGLDNGINNCALTVTDSTLTIKDGSGRGITARTGAPCNFTGNSVVTITGNGEGDIVLNRYGTGPIIIEEGVTLTAADVRTNASSIIQDGNGNAIALTEGGLAVTPPVPVAQIGETKYKTLAEALTAAKAAGMTEVEVVLLDDAQFSTITSLVGSFSKITFKGTARNQTLDINLNSAFDVRPSTEFVFDGLTVSRLDTSSDAWLYHYFSAKKITYNDCELVGEFTVMHQDTDFVNCAFTVPESYGKHYALWVCKCDNRTVNVTGCTFAGYDRAIKMYGDGFSSTMTLNISDSQLAISKKNKTAVEIAVDKGNKGTFNLVINNCTKTNFGTSEHVGAKWGENLVSEWFNAEIKSEIVANGDTFNVYVDGERIFMPCAKVGETSYCDLQKAVDAAEAGGTVELIGNVTLISDLIVNKLLTITTGGYAIIGNITVGDGYALTTSATAYMIIGAGYAGEVLPAAPVVDGNTITVTPENIQYTLDGAYGSIDGKTIVLSEGEYPKLYFARATKFPASGTEYYKEQGETKYTTIEDIQAHRTEWGTCHYNRTMQNVTLKPADGATVTIAGAECTSGHITGPAYDYLLDYSGESGSMYYLSQTVSNITFDGLTFTGKVNFETSASGDGYGEWHTTIAGVTFDGCTFTGSGTASSVGAAIRYYSEAATGYVSGLTVTDCTFNNWYQGVYCNGSKDITVTKSAFDTTGHNAIAVQTQASADAGAIAITDNAFKNIGDRVIRFGSFATGTEITITGNTATNSGDSDGEVIKASGVADGIPVTMASNTWDQGAKSGSPEFGAAGIGTTYYMSLTDAIAAANSQNVDEITILNGATESPDAAWKVADGKLVRKVYVAQIGTTKYETLAAALAAALDGETVTLISGPDTAISAAGEVTGGKTVTVTGTAKFNWDGGWLMVGRGNNAGDGTLIFKDATITRSSDQASYGFNISCKKNGSANTCNGTVIITNSTIDCDFMINKGTLAVYGKGTVGETPDLTVHNGWGVGGRPASETESGEHATATVALSEGAYVKVVFHNGMGNGYEGNAVMTLTDGSVFEYTGDSFANGDNCSAGATGKIVIDATSLFKATKFQNTANGNSSIAIDATGITAPVKVIDCTNSGATDLAGYGTVTVTGGEAYVEDGDLWVKKPAVAQIGDTYYDTFAAAIAAADAAVAGGNDDPVIIALDPTAAQDNGDWKFVTDDSVVPAVTKLVRKVYVAQIDTTKYETVEAALADAQGSGATIEILANSTETPDHALEVLMGGNITLTASTPVRVEIAPTAKTSSVDNDGMAYIRSASAAARCTFTVGENVTLAFPATAAGKGAMYIGYSSANAADVVVNGRLETYVPYVGSLSTLTVNPSGSIKSVSEDLIVRWGAAVNVIGTGADWSDSNPQAEFGYVELQGGVTRLKDTYAKGGAWVHLYNRNADKVDQYGATTLVLDNSVLATSKINNEAVIELDVDSQIVTPDVQNTGSINIDATGITQAAKVIDYTGSGTLALADYGTVTVTAGEAYVDGNDLWVKKPSVAQIGETKYETLAAAVAAAQDGDTITLLKNVELTDRLFVNAGATPAYAGSNNRYATTSENKAITLDMNGKNITSASNIALAGGSLNITGTGKISTTTDGLAPIEVRGTGDLASKRTLVIGEYVTLDGGSYGLNVFGSNDAQKNLIDVTVNGTVNGTLFVLGNLKNTENAINIVVNGTVTAAAGTAEDVSVGIALNGNANVTVNAPASVSGDSGIEVRAGSLTVNGGTIMATSQTYSYNPNGSGCTTKGAAIAVAQYGKGLATAVTLNGGTLSGKKTIGVTDVNGNMDNVSVIATQGYTQSSAIPDGYKWVETETTGKYTLAPMDYVAQVGTAKYESLAEAFAAAQDGDTVTLLKNVELTDRLFVNAGAAPAYAGSNNRYATTSENKAITLDLNGKNITSASNIALAGGSLNITGTGTISTTGSGLAPIEVRGTGDLANKRTLTIGAGVTLNGDYGLNVFGSNDAQKNIIDVTVNGTVNGTLFVLGNLKNTENAINIVVNGTVAAKTGTSEDVNVGIALNGNAKVTVNEGATVSGDSGIEVRAGTLTVNGGTITGTASEYSYKANGSGSTTKGAAIAVAQHGTALDTAVTLNGGTLEGVKTIGVTDVNGNMDKVSVLATQGYTAGSSIPDDYKWVAVENTDPAMYRLTAKDYVAQVGEAKYEVFADAWEAANAADGSTLKLLADVELTEQYQADGNFTLDLNGKNINTTHRLRLHTGSLAIANTGAADETHGVITTSNAGMAPVEVRYTDDAATPSAKRALTIGAGVTLTGSEYGLNVFGTNSETKNVIDVTVDGTVNGTLFVLGNLKNAENEINIVVNGKVIAPAGEGDNVNVGIALNGNAKVTVNNDATVSGDSGIEVRAGTLTVNGGTITGTASEYSYKANGSGSTTKGAAIAVAQHGTALDTVVTLNGGTLEGVKTIGVTDVNGNMDNVEVLAKQGFTENSAIPDDYKWVETETSGVYELVPKDYVAQIGDDGEKFETLAEAFAAAQSGETVKLLKDIELTNRLFVNAGATPAYGGSNNRYATTSENKTLTLDMNDHDITGSSNIALAGGSLTITGTGKISTTTSGLAPIEVRGTGSLTSKRTLTIDTGVTLEGKCYGVNVFGSNNADKNVIDVNVNGTVKGMVFVLGNLTNSANEININVTGTVDASAATGEESVHTAIAQCGYSTVTVSDGAVVKGESGIETRAGTLTVNGGTITATEAYNYASNGSGTTTKGAAVAVAQYGADRVTSVTINNGTLSGEKKIAVTDVNNDMSKVKVFAKEADTTPTVIPAGYSWAKSTEKPGMWTLVKQLDSFTYPIEGTAGIPVDLQWLEDNLEDVTLPILETQTDDIIAALSEQGDNGIPVWQSYVLGLDPKSATSQLRLAATAKDATTVTITGIIDTTKFPEIANVTVTFRLASRNADGTWSNVDGCTGAATPSFDVSLDDVAGKVLAIFADIVTK